MEAVIQQTNVRGRSWITTVIRGERSEEWFLLENGSDAEELSFWPMGETVDVVVPMEHVEVILFRRI